MGKSLTIFMDRDKVNTLFLFSNVLKLIDNVNWAINTEQNICEKIIELSDPERHTLLSHNQSDKQVRGLRNLV